MPDGSLCNVVLLNDDETPAEFVVTVLQDFLGRGFDEANGLMLRVHRQGKGICGIYERAEAERRVSDILAFAVKHGHPLKCILEQAD